MGFPPPEDAPPLNVQIAAGIGVPNPAPPLPQQQVAAGGASFGVSAGISSPDAPSLPDQITASADASFQPVIPGVLGLIAALCGFTLPGFDFSVSFTLELPPFPPTFLLSLAIGLACDLSDPLDAKFDFGGGRLPSPVPDLSSDFAAAA